VFFAVRDPPLPARFDNEERTDMKLRSTLLAATVLTLPVAAKAQMMPNLTGFYVGAGVGGNLLQDEKLKTLGGVDTGDTLRSEWGPLALGYLGYELGNGLSLQLEGVVRNNKFNELRGAVPGSAGGTETKYGPMVNLIFDLSPYIGQYVPFAPYAQEYVGGSSGGSGGGRSGLRMAALRLRLPADSAETASNSAG
jgi:hypothetical protein